jgi:deoxyribonuclease V
MPLKAVHVHPWKVTPREAISIQESLQNEVRIEPLSTEIRLVAGADVSFRQATGVCCAAVVVMDIASMSIVERAGCVFACAFPYVPGLLTFREGPPLLEALARLETVPDVLMCDGQGIAHPRRMGLAAHIGYLLDIPAVGCAKTRLFGDYQEPENKAGAFTPLVWKGQVLGSVLRTKANVKAIYVSPGHRMDVESSVTLVLRCGTGYRVPEPVRQAHIWANRMSEETADTNLPLKVYPC